MDTAKPTDANTAAVVQSRVALPHGVHLHCARRAGQEGKPTLLMLHGYADSSYAFMPLLEHLPPVYPVLLPSLRGHGQSDKPARYYEEDFVADIQALIALLELDNIVLIGHSMGSFFARQLALQLPEICCALVLIGSATRLGQAGAQGLHQAVQQAVIDYSLSTALTPTADAAAQTQMPLTFIQGLQASIASRIDAATLARLAQESQQAPVFVWQRLLEHLGALDHRALLEHISQPTLLLWGDQDPLFGAEEQDWLEQHIPRLQRITYLGNGHAPQLEHPVAVARDILRFVQQIA